MTVHELIQMLELIDPDLTVKSNEGKEFSGVGLYMDNKGQVFVEVE